MIILFIRSFIFNLFFFIWSFLVSVCCAPLLLFGTNISIYAGKIWAWPIVMAAKYICGIKYEIKGEENIPSEYCIIASEHQSAWETLIFFVLFPKVSYILKQELTRIPFYGLYLNKRMAMINIDRKAGASSLKKLVKEAKEYIEQGRQIVIFPQGTRVKAEDNWKIFSGITALYKIVPGHVVPVSLNSGRIWPRNSFIKKPGLITLQFHPPLSPLLSKEEVIESLVKIYKQDGF